MIYKRLLLAVGIVTSLVTIARAQGDETPRQVLFTNVNIFDGVNDWLIENGSVLVEGNLIKTVSDELIDAPDAYTVDSEGRTLMPGLIDMHSHLCLRDGMNTFRTDYDQMTAGAYTALFMLDYLNQSFTTACDAGCNILGIAKAVNNGIVPDPRIFPSGGFLSQTGGHADTGFFNDRPGDMDDLESHMFGFIVDGLDEAMKAARRNLRAGATQIKIMAGGGVSSEFDTLHTTQFSEEEMRAIVGVEEDYGTYVMAHAYHGRSVNRAIDAGVRVIEHNFLVSEDMMIRMKDEGVAMSIQAVISHEAFGDPEPITFYSADQKAKAAQVNTGDKQMLNWAVECDLHMVTGGDIFGPYGGRQADNIFWYDRQIAKNPVLSLKTATSNTAVVLSWSGGLNLYKERLDNDPSKLALRSMTVDHPFGIIKS